MRRALALLIVLFVVALVRQSAPEAPDVRSTALALGFALIAAALVGDLFVPLRLPRITGYLLFGMVCGPYLADLISRPMAQELQIVNGLAIAFIALIAGLEMNFAHLRARIGALLRFAGVTLVVSYTGLLAIFWIAWPWLPIAPELTGAARLALAGLLACVVVSFSPMVSIAVITESRARGPLSELVMTTVVLGDLLVILLFTLLMQFVRLAIGATAPGEVGLLPHLAWEIFGSFAFGAMAGAAFALYLRLVGREVTVVLLALCVVLSEIGSRMHFDPLLAALMAGLVVENVARPQGEALKRAVEQGALPVLVVFFAAAGASLQLDALASIGLIAVAVAGARIALIRLGTSIASRGAPFDPPAAGMVWMGLVAQTGVTLGLAVIVATEFPGWGVSFQTLLLALIALHQIVGPVLFRAALARAGEIGRMDAPDRPPDG